MPQSQSKAKEILCHPDYIKQFIQIVLLSIKIINKTSTSYSGKFSLSIINKI